MFIPTGIDYPYMDRSWVTLAIFVLCVLLLGTHVLENDLPEGVALDPSNFRPHQLITSVFFHVGPLHLLGNMLFLYVFGRYVEARLGRLKFAAAFLLFGIAGGTAWILVGPDVPAVGSSDAICGLVGFVLAVAPHNKLNMVFIWGPRVDLEGGFQIAVGWMIAWWIGWDVFYVLTGETGGVAIVAHLGGYATGFGVGYGLSRPQLEGTHWYVEPPPRPGDRTQGKRLREARGTRLAPGARAHPDSRVVPTATSSLAADRPHEVVLNALGAETSPVAVIKLLMKRRGLAPEEAKSLVDAVQAGDAQVLDFETVDAASRFAEEGRQLAVELSLRRAPAPS